jgi:hypothetical protein
VGAVQVIVVSPVFDNLPRMAVAGEEVLVEALITQTSIDGEDGPAPNRLVV